MKFGETTDSYDADGELVASLPVPPLTVDELNEAGGRVCRRPDANAADGFGRQEGRRAALQAGAQGRGGRAQGAAGAYLQFPVLGLSRADRAFRVACTKGTYVRSLAHELGQKLGCGAHLATLRRVVSGKFNVADAIEFEQVHGIVH